MFGKSAVRQLLEFCFGVLVAALMLTWAWQLLRPLVPLLVGLAVVIVAVRLYVRRYRQW